MSCLGQLCGRNGHAAVKQQPASAFTLPSSALVLPSSALVLGGLPHSVAPSTLSRLSYISNAESIATSTYSRASTTYSSVSNPLSRRGFHNYKDPALKEAHDSHDYYISRRSGNGMVSKAGSEASGSTNNLLQWQA